MCIYRAFLRFLKNHLSTPPKDNLSFFVNFQRLRQTHDGNETIRIMHKIFKIFF